MVVFFSQNSLKLMVVDWCKLWEDEGDARSPVDAAPVGAAVAGGGVAVVEDVPGCGVLVWLEDDGAGVEAAWIKCGTLLLLLLPVIVLLFAVVVGMAPVLPKDWLMAAADAVVVVMFEITGAVTGAVVAVGCCWELPLSRFDGLLVKLERLGNRSPISRESFTGAWRRGDRLERVKKRFL